MAQTHTLPYHALHDQRASFRAVAAALVASTGKAGYLPGDEVTVKVGTFTVTTTKPLAAADKYTKAARRATKPNATRPIPKWSEADERHYRKINGQATLLEEEHNHTMAKPYFPAAEVSETCKARAQVKYTPPVPPVKVIRMPVQPKPKLYTINLERPASTTMRLRKQPAPPYKIDLTRR